MADKEQVNNQKDLNAELRETSKSQAETRQTLQEILFEQRNLADESRKFAKQLFGSASQATATARAFRGISNVTKEINSQIEGVIRGEIKFGDLQKSRNKLAQEERLFRVELDQAIDSARDKEGKLLFTEEEQLAIKSGQVDLADALVEKIRYADDDSRELLSIYNDQLQNLKEQKD